MRSSRNRSPKGMRLERRISHWKKLGEVKRLRPRLPLQPAPAVVMPGMLNVEPLFVRQTFATPNVTPGMKGDVVRPQTVGRAWDATTSRRVSCPVMTVKGWREEN